MIIGISGKKGTGKDTAADMIIKDYPFEKKKFAGKLKQITACLLGRSVEWIENNKESLVYLCGEWNTVREWLIIIGTDLFRAKYPDFWVSTLLSDYREGMNWVISDVRFPNELTAIKEMGGYVIRIEREGSNDDNITETALDDCKFDVIIDNNGSLEDLHKQIQRWTKRNV